MKLSWYIAGRYLRSKKSLNAINLIAYISIGGVAVGTMALVIILSVFNGINLLISEQISAFDPDLKITASSGKSFLPTESFDRIKQMKGVASYIEVVEENALLRYNNRQSVAVVKGVPADYDHLIGLDSTFLVEGKFIWNKSAHDFTVIGQGLAVNLSVGIDYTEPVQFYAPKKGRISLLTADNALNRANLFVSGVFAVHQEIDSKYILVPFDFAKELFEMGDRISSVEIQFEKGTNGKSLKSQIKQMLGKDFLIKDQMEQHETIYRVMHSEKWAIFAILTFILIIASFNILGSLLMVIIDKKHDITILQSMGANNLLIRRIFLLEGWMTSVFGSLIGIICGSVIAWLQETYHLVKLPGAEGTYIMTYYPVHIQLSDLITIFLVVATVGFLLSWYPVRYISGKYLDFSQE